MITVVRRDSYNAKMSLTIRQAQSSCLATLFLGGLENRQIQTNFLQLLFWGRNVTGCIWSTDDWTWLMPSHHGRCNTKYITPLPPSNCLDLSHFCVDKNVKHHIFFAVVATMRAGICSWLLQLLGVRGKKKEKKKMQSQSMTTRCHPSKKRQQRLIIAGNWTCFSLHRKQRLVLNCE